MALINVEQEDSDILSFEVMLFIWMDVITYAVLKFDLAEGLRYLDLSQCGLGAEGAKLVAEMIRENKGLLELRIKENHIGETGTQYIAEALQENFTLERLSLNKNMIFDAGCKHIADVRFGNLVFSTCEIIISLHGL